MPAHLIPCGDFSFGYGGEFERECVRRLRDELPDCYVVASNVTLDRGGGSFLECDAVVSTPGTWVVLEMKAMRSRVVVFEDLLRGAGRFSIDRVFSTLDLKAKVLRSRRRRPPFPQNAAHLAGRITSMVVVPDESNIVFKYAPHSSSPPVMTARDVIGHLKALAAGSGGSGSPTLQRELQKGWLAYAGASAPTTARSGRQLGRFRIKRQLSATADVSEFEAVDEPPCAAEVRLREFRVDPTMSLQDLDKDLERVAREMSVLRRIRHPSVSCVLSHFQTECSWVEVSDWFDGVPLETLWPAMADATASDRASIALRVIGALDYCHERGVFHRNVSADAVLVPEQALHEALCCRDLSEVSLRIGVTKVYETFAPLPGGHFE